MSGNLTTANLTSDLPPRMVAIPTIHSVQPTAQALESIEAAAWADMVAAAPAELLATAGIERTRLGRLRVLAAARHDVLAFNRVLAVDGHGGLDATTVADLVAFYARRGVARFFLPWHPGLDSATPGEILHPAGFRFHNHWVKLWRGVELPTAVASPFALRVLRPVDAPAFDAVLAAAFDWPEELRALWSGVIGRRRWHHFGLVDDDRLVAVAGLFLDSAGAWFGPAATVPSHRGRGAQQELLAHRILLARAAGCRWLTVETADGTPERPATSLRNTRRIGFEIAYRRPNYLRQIG